MPSPAREHVVVISIDGMLPAYYLDESWPAPAIRQLYREGAHAVGVRSVFPSLTYPGHTTLVTGALRARHGICHNKHIEPSADPPWLKDASRVQDSGSFRITAAQVRKRVIAFLRATKR